MGRAAQHHNSEAEAPIDDDLTQRIVRRLQIDAEPLIREHFPEPIRLTKDADKGDAILYAIGRGKNGLVVQYRSPEGNSAPASMASFATHAPYVFDTLDMELVLSLETLFKDLGWDKNSTSL